jgi:hypothetical protein
MDRFINKFRNEDGTMPVIGFGAGKFAPTGKGELPVPTTSVFKRVSQRCKHVEMIDEFRTTQTHNKCMGRVHKVQKSVAGEMRGVRGLCYCDSNCHSFLNRDLNAALNMLDLVKRLFDGRALRPEGLMREHCKGQGGQKRITLVRRKQTSSLRPIGASYGYQKGAAAFQAPGVAVQVPPG